MRLLDVLNEEESKKRTYRILLAIPFADNDNIKGKLSSLEFDLKQNGVEIKRIASSTIDQHAWYIDVRTALVLYTDLKRTEIENIIEPAYKIIQFREDD